MSSEPFTGIGSARIVVMTSGVTSSSAALAAATLEKCAPPTASTTTIVASRAVIPARRSAKVDGFRADDFGDALADDLRRIGVLGVPHQRNVLDRNTWIHPPNDVRGEAAPQSRV